LGKHCERPRVRPAVRPLFLSLHRNLPKFRASPQRWNCGIPFLFADSSKPEASGFSRTTRPLGIPSRRPATRPTRPREPLTDPAPETGDPRQPCLVNAEPGHRRPGTSNPAGHALFEASHVLLQRLQLTATAVPLLGTFVDATQSQQPGGLPFIQVGQIRRYNDQGLQ